MNNLIVDEYRKHKTTSLDVILEKGFEPSVDESERIFNIFDGKAALLLIQQLPEKYKKIMRMKYEKLLSLKEISLILGQSKNSVAVQLHRGLAKLKELYKFNKK
ncbi:MAG: sigma-70 family RNA polymerase sigma factor [Candidatus Paceibacterota bacterium]